MEAILEDFVLDYLHCFIWGNVEAILETLS